MVLCKQRQRGMTLFEITVAIALFALFTLTLTQLLMGGMRVYKRGQVLSTMRNDLKNAMETVSNDVRMAQSFPDMVIGKSNTLKFYIYPQDLTDPTKTLGKVAVTYELDSTNGLLTRTEGSSSTLLARDLLISSTATNSESYFQLVADGTNEDNPNYIVEIRLSALRYVGTDEQRLSMVTRATASALYEDSYTRNPVDMVPVVEIGDLRPPFLPRFTR